MSDPIVLINSVYSYRNRGDSAIVEAMGSCLKKAVPHAQIWLLSQFWQENAAYYKELGWDSAPPLWDIPMDDNKARRLARAAGSFGSLLLGRTRRVKSGIPDVRELYRQARLIVDAGGGSLYSSSRHLFYLGLYQHLFNLWMGKKLHKPVIIAPQSIGPFNKRLDEKAVCSLLRKLDVVMVREPISARFLEERGVACQTVPDAAFLGDFGRPASPRIAPLVEQMKASASRGVNVGITVLDWRWAYEESTRTERDVHEYLRKLADALAGIGRHHDIHVFVFPQVTAGFGDSDTAVSGKLQELLRGRVKELTVFGEDHAAVDLQQLYGCMHVFVGSRMHSAILALLAGVPTVGLAYQPKTIGTFDLLGLREFAFDIRTFNPEELKNRLIQMIGEQQALRQRIQASVTRARTEVTAAFQKHIVPLISSPTGVRE